MGELLELSGGPLVSPIVLKFERLFYLTPGYRGYQGYGLGFNYDVYQDLKSQLVSLVNRNFIAIVHKEDPKSTLSAVFLDPKDNRESFIVNKKLSQRCSSVRSDHS